MNGYIRRWKKEDLPWERVLSELVQRDYQMPVCPEILRDACGKPYFKDSSLYFNVSHSGEYLAIVISGAPVGIDLQKYRSVREGMYRKVVQPQEQPLIGKNKERDFIRLWSLKESFVKAEGKGLRIPMREYFFQRENEEYFVNYGGQRAAWTFNIEETLLEEYMICVCGMEKEILWSVEDAV